MSRALIVCLAIVAVALFISGTANPGGVTSQRTTLGSLSTMRAGQVSCPQHVLYRESSEAPVSEALHAAQSLLARVRFVGQGLVFHLTPSQAPIDHLVKLSPATSTYDQTMPGLVAISHVAAAACGESVAGASWALHYSIPGGMASNQGFPFLVKTRTGWKFWGYWCGADKSRKWRDKYC